MLKRSIMKTMILLAAVMGLAVGLAACSSVGEPASTPGIQPTTLVTSAVEETMPAGTENAPADEATYPPPNAPGTEEAYPPANAPGFNQPWAPQPADSAFQRGEAFIDVKDVLVLESMPPQFQLNLVGNLPTPCHQLRVAVSPPGGDNSVNVEVYSVADPARMCAQVLEPFEASVPLRGLATGKYTILVNDEPVGEIDVP